jgi:biopolymer transport protein ExbB
VDIELLKSVVDYGVIALLIFMSFISVWFFIERLFFLKTVQIENFKTKKSLEIAMTRHMSIIGTIASNAPYIGLLGTVLAIMLTFMTMSNADIVATKIMASLALALKATAAGLVVAILSQIFYNTLARFIEVVESRFDEAREI